MLCRLGAHRARGDRELRHGTDPSSRRPEPPSLTADAHWKGAFYNNWARMLDDDSPNGAVGCFVPHSPLSVGGAQMNYAGKGFAPANKSCDASWASAYPSAVYSVMRTVSRQIYPGT